MSKKHLASLALSIASLAGAASAAPITDRAELPDGLTLVDFEDFALGTRGPIVVGNMTLNSVGASAQVVRQGFTQFPGIFDGQYFGQGVLDYRFDFADPISAFGVGIFDPNFDATVLEAFDADGNLIDSYDVEQGPIGGVFSDYGGFLRDERDISYVVLSAAPGDLLAVDNILFQEARVDAPVPVPAAALLFAPALGFLARKRRKA